MKASLKNDFWIVVLIIAVSVPFILLHHARPLTTAAIFYILPTLYLFWRKPKPARELLAGALLLGVGFAFPFDVIQTASGGWLTPIDQLVFPYSFFGFLPLDEVLWFVIQTLFVLTFYVHFFEPRKADRVGRRFVYFLLATLSAVLLISFFAALGRENVAIPYSYLVAGSPMLLAVGYVMWRYPRLIPKFVKTAAFFFALFLVYELIALHLGQWEFRGEYIGWVQLWGARFPLEEFFYWMIVYTLFELSIYEGAIDDGR